MDIADIINIAQKAGEEILSVYHNPELFSQVDFKADDSPLTLADQHANQLIVNSLQTLPYQYPILSEESKQADYEVRKDWDKFWLVDPLDGTKEFVNRNGEFTVNIALIENKKTIAGVIHVPVTGCTYYGYEGRAFKIMDGKESEIHVRNMYDERIAVRSKSHATPEEDEVLKRYNADDFISVGSSLKFCMVAEGKADMYYRHGPTMEWDTGAGQAILEAAGGKVYSGNDTLRHFEYNKEDLRNGSFLCLGF